MKKFRVSSQEMVYYITIVEAENEKEASDLVSSREADDTYIANTDDMIVTDV
jgi:hypothetical protein